MISLILLKLFTFSQILQGVPKLSHATVCICICIYICIYTDAPDINMLTNVFFFGCLYFIESDTCTTDESWCLFKLFSSERAVPTSDIQLHWYSMVKQAPWLLIVFCSWIHGKQKHLNNTCKYQVWFTCFTCRTESVAGMTQSLFTSLRLDQCAQ